MSGRTAQSRQIQVAASTALGLVIGCALFIGSAHAADSKPNVLIILADDLGFNDVGYNGSIIRTPALDELASQGIVLDHFYAHPYCSPTRSALMTGDAPIRNGVLRPFGKNSTKSLPLERKIMPEYFREAGYQTYLVGKWHLGRSKRSQLPQARGFDHFYGHVTGGIGYWDKVHGGGYDWQRNGETVREGGYATHLLSAEAQRLLTDREPGTPFFLLASFNAPHLPNEAPADTIASYSHIADLRRRMHAAMVSELDAAVADIIDVLKRDEVLGNTIIWFLSDNGGLIRGAVPDLSFAMVDRQGSPLREGDPKPELFIDFVTLNQTEGASSNEPYQRGKGSAYEGGIHVPSFVTWPGRVLTGKEESLITVEDVLPTLLELAGIGAEKSEGRDGVDQSAALLGEGPVKTHPFVAAGSDGDAYVTMPWKLIRPARGEPALFNLERDPTERVNLAQDLPRKVAELSLLLDQFPRGEPVTTVGGKVYPDFIWDPDFFGGREDREPWADVVTD